MRLWGAPVQVVSSLGPAAHLPHRTHLLAAVVVALASAGCYAASAVLQQRQASRQVGGGAAALLWRLAGQPLWWLAVAATLAGAGLHVGALALGPLIVVQPLGVLALAFALPLGAALSARRVSAGQWAAAGAVVAGLLALVVVSPHHVRPPHVALAQLSWVAMCLGGFVAAALLLARRLGGRAAPVVRAAAAASCFGTASAMARIAVTDLGVFALAAALAVGCAAGGFAIAQLAYRDGGLGAPLATVTLVDPAVAVTIGVTLLGEPLALGPVRLGVGAAGLASTAVGIWLLARSHPAGHQPAEAPPGRDALDSGHPAVPGRTGPWPGDDGADDDFLDEIRPRSGARPG